VMVDAEVREVVGEPTAGELRAVIGQHPGELGADAGQPLGDVVDKGSGIPRGLVAGDQGADPRAGGGVDRGGAQIAFLYTTMTTTIDANGVPTVTVNSVSVVCRG
jgi:hypothetical protein